MSEFEKWLKRNWKDYQFTKWKKDFGQRLVGKLEGRWHSRIVLVYHFTERKPTVEDFASFLKDLERFYNDYESDYDLDGAYFILYGDYEKKAFNLLLKRVDDELRDLVKIKSLEEKSMTIPTKPSQQRESLRKKIFIVHGREKLPALELARIIDNRYPIKTIFLEEEAHGGDTLLEKLEKNSDVDFAFITLTPDDVGALKGEILKERGRQNVIFEWGLFLGKIKRKNICILVKGNVEIPSDLQGIGYHRFKDEIKECFLEVDGELRKAGLIE